MYTKIHHFLPNKYCDRLGRSWAFCNAIPTIMMAKVEHNQHFGIHTDTGCAYDKQNYRYSKYTVLLYLNDDFDGGCTTFFSDNFKELFSIKPKTGRILCFDIDRYHRGEHVLSGCKCWIGTELVCSKV